MSLMYPVFYEISPAVQLKHNPYLLTLEAWSAPMSRCLGLIRQFCSQCNRLFSCQDCPAPTWPKPESQLVLMLI